MKTLTPAAPSAPALPFCAPKFPEPLALTALRALAAEYRRAWNCPAGGFIITFGGKVCGWGLLPRADYYRPGVIAIGERVAMYACGPAGSDTARSWESVLLDQ